MYRKILATFLLVGLLNCQAAEPPGTDELLKELREAVQNRDVKRVLAAYDFSNVHQIHKDEEHVEWKGYFESLGNARVLAVKFVPLIYGSEKEREKIRNGYKVGPRHYRPNIPVSGLVLVETDTVQFLHPAGLSKEGKLRLSSTTVVGLQQKGESGPRD